MSDYRSEQLVTYVAGPFSILVGVLMIASSMGDLMSWPVHRSLGVAMTITGLFSGFFLVAYGTYLIRQGRRRLRGGPWRAEHYMP